MSRIRLGDMLVAANMVTLAQVEQALALQKERGGKLGELLVELGHVTEVQLAQALSNHLSVPWVNLYHVDFSRDLLNLLTPEAAEKFGCIPVYVRKVRKQGDTLFVATDDPTNELALEEIARLVGMPVKPMVASSSDVRNAVGIYYLGRAAEAPKKARPPSMVPPSIAPVHLDEAELELAPVEAAAPAPAPAVAPAPPPSSSEEAPEVVVEPLNEPLEAELRAEVARKKQQRAKFVTLTMLDGTTVRLPAAAPKKAAEERPEHALTTRDLISALVARSQGKDVSSVLPDARWEPIVAAMLSLLLRKGLIADWEFVEEWSKQRK